MDPKFTETFLKKADYKYVMPIIFCSYLVLAAVFIILQVPLLALSYAVTAFILIGVSLSPLVNKSSWLSYFLFLSTVLNVFVATALIGKEGGFYFYLFIFPIFGYVNLPQSQMRWFNAATLALFAGLFIWLPANTNALSSVTIQLIYAMNFLIVMGMYFLVFRIYHRRNIDSLFQMSELASKDPLTGLLNRREMTQQLNDLNKTEKKYYVMLIDLDNFKSINDLYGHDVGDKVIQTAAAVFQSYADKEKKGVASRWGGEEFLLCMQGDTLEDMEIHFNECMKNYQQETLPINLHYPPSFSAGVTLLRSDLEQVLKDADALLYEAKEKGKAQIKSA